jgi:RNA polymerase sigma-70 factor (ECF subfamily)
VTPERVYERQWAAALLDQVLDRLRDELTRAGKRPLFDLLKSRLTGDTGDASYRDAAETLHLSEASLRVAAHRLRRRYRELLRAEVARTVTGPAQEIDDEIRYLFNATRQ